LPGAFDRVGEFALVLGAGVGLTTVSELHRRRQELSERFRILKVNLP